MSARYKQGLCLIVWAALICAPLSLTLAHVQWVKPVDENRRKAERPAVVEFTRQPWAYVTKWLRWFEDGFGGRDELIRLKNQIDYTIFGRSDRVYVGPDGFLFYRSLADEVLPNVERTPNTVYDANVEGLERFGAELAKRNVQLVVLTIPLKYTVYPELLPREAPRLPRDRKFDEFRTKLARMPHVLLFDATPVMIAAKPRVRVFNRTDFHWSEPGAFEVSEKLAAVLADRAGVRGYHRHWVPTFAPRPFSGGEAAFLPLLRQPSETALFPTSQPPYPDEGKEPPFGWVVHNDTSDPTLLPAVLYIGDSFVWALHNTGFSKEFTTFRFSHVLHDQSRTIHRHLPEDTRFVILELIETMIEHDYLPR